MEENTQELCSNPRQKSRNLFLVAGYWLRVQGSKFKVRRSAFWLLVSRYWLQVTGCLVVVSHPSSPSLDSCLLPLASCLLNYFLSPITFGVIMFSGNSTILSCFLVMSFFSSTSSYTLRPVCRASAATMLEASYPI